MNFGPEIGARVEVIAIKLYGLKSAGSSSHKNLESILRHLGYKPCLASPETCMKPSVKLCGFK